TGGNVRDGDRVEALQSPERGHRRSHQLFGPGRRPGHALLDQVRHDLGVGLRAEAMSRAGERLTQLAVVRHDAVVDEREPARAVEMLMRVLLGHATVRGRARVTDADRARRQFRRGLTDLADAPLEDDPVSVTDGHAPRVVAAILELLEPAQDEVRGARVTSDVAEDATHGEPPGRG